MHYRIFGIVFASFFFAGCQDGARVDRHGLPATNFQADANYWDSGAEISHYTLSQSRYGELHEGHAQLIFAAEPFLPDKQVKDESGSTDSVPALKLNALRTFSTGIYDYRTMLSVFVGRDRPHIAYKLTTSVQDWCGQSFFQINRRGSRWKVQLRSYFENEGDTEATLGASLLEDAYWVQLRLKSADLPEGRVKMVPSTIFSRFRHINSAAENAIISRETVGHLTVHTIRYPQLGRTLTIRADSSFPHVIRSWQESFEKENIVTTAKLKGQMRQTEYWRLNETKHADLRAKIRRE